MRNLIFHAVRRNYVRPFAQFLVAASIPLFLTACSEIIGAKGGAIDAYNPEAAFPLFSDTLDLSRSLGGRIADESLFPKPAIPDSLFSLVFNNTIRSSSVEDVIGTINGNFDANTTGFTLNQSVPAAGLPYNSTVAVNFSSLFSPARRLAYMVGKAGSLDLTIASNMSRAQTINIELPNVTDVTGATLKQTVNVPANGTVTASFPLANNAFDLEPTPSAANVVQVRLSGTLATGSASVGQRFTISPRLTNAKIKYFYGNIGPLPLADNFNNIVTITAFLKVEPNTNSVILIKPSIVNTFRNYVGAPFSVSLRDIVTYRDENTLQRLEGTGVTTLGNGIAVPAATKATPDRLPSAVTAGRSRFLIDTSNTNIVSTINSLTNWSIRDVYRSIPTKLRYSIKANGTAPTGSNQFAFDTSHVYVDSDITLPLFGQMNNYTTRDTVRLDWNAIFGGSGDFEVNKLTFKFTTINTFPLQISSQVYFLTEDFRMVDSLIVLRGSDQNATNNIVSRIAAVNPRTYRVDIPKDSRGRPIYDGFPRQSNEFSIPKARIQRLKSQAKRAVIRTFISSSTQQAPQGKVKIYSDNGCIVKIGCVADISVKQTKLW